jgi:hypothetical protein
MRKIYSLAKFANFVYFVLHAEIATIFTKFANFARLAIFSAFYNLSQPNFAILLILVYALFGNILFLPR